MNNKGLEGSCPVCKLGEVVDNECNYCRTIFCSKCGGVIRTRIGFAMIIEPCKCEKKK